MRELPNICACEPARLLIEGINENYDQVQQRRQELLSSEQIEVWRTHFNKRPGGLPVRMWGADYYDPDKFAADIAKSNEQAFCRDERFLAELEGRLGWVMLKCPGAESCTVMYEGHPRTETDCSSSASVEELQEDLDTHFWRFFD